MRRTLAIVFQKTFGGEVLHPARKQKVLQIWMEENQAFGIIGIAASQNVSTMV